MSLSVRLVKSMDSGTAKGKEILSDEEIIEYKAQLSRAKPYTYEEIADMEYDACDFDIKRMEAYNAQRALREAGILE